MRLVYNMPYKYKNKKQDYNYLYREAKKSANLCRSCGNKKNITTNSCNKCNLKQKIKDRERNRQLKIMVIYYYSNGNMKCSCCGESYIEFLTIEHIHGGGKKHQQIVNRFGNGYYRWLIENNFPNGIDVMCMNCNWAKGKFGKCPHKKTLQGSVI